MSETTDPRKVALDELVAQAQELKLDYQPTADANPTTDPQTAMDHLREVLMILQDLSPMDGCEALEAARKFYNAANPTAMVLPSAGWVTRLVSVGPLDWPHAAKERCA